ncbi:MAG: hypothetical protein HQK96_20850 [Nitrospirae bacterium]|nr:hypothetical protein [Nitrospirota bacterium]
MKLLFITDNDGLFKAFSKVLGILLDAEINLIVSETNIDIDFIQNEDIFIIEGNEQKVSNWLWGVIRKKYLNPVIVLAYVQEAIFLKKNPAFKEGASRYHRYLEPPHTINRFLQAVADVHPLYDEDTRRLVYEKYGCPYIEDRLFRLIDHDLKLCEREKDLSVLNDALNYSEQLQDNELTQKLRLAVQHRLADDIVVLDAIKQDMLSILRRH